MNVAPTAILQILKSMCGQRRKKHATGEKQFSTGAPKTERNSEQAAYRSRSGSRGRVPSGSRKNQF